MGQLHASIIGRRRSDDNTSNHYECARIQRVDATDRRVLALLAENGRRSFEELSRDVRLSAPAVKRRIDRLRATGPLRGFTAIVDDEALGWRAEAFVELYFAPDTAVRGLLAALQAMPEALGAGRSAATPTRSPTYVHAITTTSSTYYSSYAARGSSSGRAPRSSSAACSPACARQPTRSRPAPKPENAEAFMRRRCLAPPSS
jgi:DNA-binding Lrp family transcriptional regulator